MSKSDREQELEQRIRELEAELASFRKKNIFVPSGQTISVPTPMQPLFDDAQKVVHEYFAKTEIDPSQATIKINDQRYLLLRASSLSVDFMNTMQKLYADKGEDAAFNIGRNFLFDIAHVIGIEDAKVFHKKMGVTDPIAKLSAGPIHFAYSGWAYVDIHEDSHPSPNQDFFLKYNHPYSFEAASWIESGQIAPGPVCIMNSGYSSGWCEASFGMELTAVETSCRACGDDHCTFIMAPPDKIEDILKEYTAKNASNSKDLKHHIPTFFERKKIEEGMREAKEKAEESEQAKSNFLANMSHEMRTPLNAIIGYISIIDKSNLNQEQLDQLNTIQRSSKHLSNIINDVLDLSKIEAHQLHISNAPCNLLELLHDSASVAKGMISHWQKPIDFKIYIEPDVPPVVLLDQTRLKQILYNVLSNAVKFTNKGYVHCSVQTKEQQLHIQIEDTGIGIPSHLHHHVFNSFGQVDSSSTREFGGTGLGLTITKKLIQLLGGKISLLSHEGEGSTFYIQIPYKDNNSMVSVPAQPPKVCKQSNYKALILLVEDNLINQKVTKHILKKAGFEVVLADNGQDAIDKFKQPNEQNIDLVIMDIQMPVLDGLSATKTIRAYEKTQKLTPTPILAFTAHATKEDMERCLDVGCNDYISKPIDPSILIEKIQEYLIIEQ
ncbi:MAG: response regulator [Aureispira sp.]|nr:response regulator [Aureispira sp.]